MTAVRYNEYLKSFKINILNTMIIFVYLKAISIREIDTLFVSKQFGYENVTDYYKEACIDAKIKYIKVPTLFLNAGDDSENITYLIWHILILNLKITWKKKCFPRREHSLSSKYWIMNIRQWWKQNTVVISRFVKAYCPPVAIIPVECSPNIWKLFWTTWKRNN